MKRKTLSELTLMDKFLFDEVMDYPEVHETVLQIILGQDNLKLLQQGQTEKEVRTAPWLRSVRLDVYAVDEEGTVYDTEMQAGYRNDLAKRSRYYQGLIDSSMLEPGVSSFNELNNTCIIMITPFDLFGEGRYRYTFREYCDENKDLSLNDGAVRIFLNTKGKNDEEVSVELRDLLHYIECTDGEFAKKTGNERIQKIHTYVDRIKTNEQTGVKYMQTWEEKLMIREEGREEGREEARALLLVAVQNVMEKLNLSMEQAMDVLGIPEDEREKLHGLFIARGSATIEK